MLYKSFLFLGIFSLLSCNNTIDAGKMPTKETYNDSIQNNTQPFAIVIHGGAGTILKEYMTDSLEMAYKKVLEEAITKGYKVLENGGSALDAVTSAIVVMEDHPLFNAGKGAVFTHEGLNELDASIMEGSTLNAGAIAGVKKIKNPILLAKKVMLESDHVLLTGQGAEEFARLKGIEWVEPSYFYTESRYQSLLKIKDQEKTQLDHDEKLSYIDPFAKNYKFGTVGCVALDKEGNIVAGTSTGGMTNKRWNRVGDSPIIGAGTYANNNTCGVSATGWGEYFIRGIVAYDIAARIEYKGETLEEATKEVIQNKLPALGGDGGVVALDKNGNISMQFNTVGMYRAAIDKNGKLTIGIYKGL